MCINVKRDECIWTSTGPDWTGPDRSVQQADRITVLQVCRQVVELSWLTIDLHLRNKTHKSI